MPHLHKSDGVALTVLGFSTGIVAARYYKSAAFERPIHFSILTLLVAGTFILVGSRVLRGNEHQPLRPSNHDTNKHLTGNTGPFDFSRRLLLSSTSRLLIVICIVARTVLFWRTIRTIHCSWDGLQSFLPFVISAYESRDGQATSLPGVGNKTMSRSLWAFSRTSLCSFLALGWGFATSSTLFLTERTTGAICPPGILERLTPLAQLVSVGLDAIVVVEVGRMRRNADARIRSWSTLGSLLLLSAGIIAFLAFWSCFDRINFRWNVFLTSVSIGDLLLDSVLVALALVSGIYLLAHMSATTVALCTVAAAVVAHLEQRIFDGTLIKAWSSGWGLSTGLAVFLIAGALFRNLGKPSTPLGSANEAGFGWYSLLAFLFVLAQTIFLGPGVAQTDTISHVIARSRAHSDAWITNARKSNTLDEAVSEYSRRHGIPPPPNFDKWYDYASFVDSPVIDDFAQIQSDLLPFWGVSPQLLRERTAELLTHPLYSFGGIVIEGGKVQISPHIKGTHRWMMEVMQNMIEPFAQWLPDMQLAFNLDDECRVSIPFEQANAYRTDGLKSQARLAQSADFRGFNTMQDPPWPKEYLLIEDEKEREALWAKESIWFQNWSKSPIFYEYISSTCSPDASVNRLHWWNRKAECLSCSAPHMQGGVVANWSLSGDLCHQPDLAYLHGVLLSPSAMAATHTLFPVFSQSRVHNFADILYPNPWNFGDKVQYDGEKGIPWDQKLNSVYWRGASSDGFAAHGAWQTFMRARFVHMAQQLNSVLGTSLLKYVTGTREAVQPSVSSSIDAPVAVNVTFVGTFNRCDERDCMLEHTVFYGSPTAEPVPSVDFQEHWRHRHLIDLDGAAFSGRFLPFLKSTSLPYRAALFRTWWEERVHPWRHFVPLDVRLRDVWHVVAYLGGKGNKDAETIAIEGSEWAKKALRKEDMRVYMFRLLLEWGRLVDDDREQLGFVPR